MALSCTACRRRKVKCDKGVPCTPCSKAGTCCVYRDRQQRSSNVKRRREPVQSDQGASRHREPTISAPKPAETYITYASTNDHQTPDSRYAFFIQRQDNARSTDPTFWNQLDESAEHSASLDGSAAQSKPESKLDLRPDTSSTLIFGATVTDQQDDLSGFNVKEQSILVPIFFTRVHPICRILHEPTAHAFFQDIEKLTHTRTQMLKFDSLRAIDCAIAFAAVKSLSPDECYSRLGVEKGTVELRLRRKLESALAACDLLNSKEIVTLQAFTLYIMFMCSTESTQSSWALLALAIRIAQGLGVHRDGNGEAWDAFHAEMRRRLWWQLVVLDVLLSVDRGSEPLIKDGSFTTRRPLHINDSDINLQSTLPIQERSEMVEMSLPLTYMEAFHTLKTINLSQVSTSSQASLASSFLEKLEKRYLVKHTSGSTDLSDTRISLLHMSGQLLSLMMWLAVQYPLHRHVAKPKDFSKHQALRTALALLEMRQRTEEAPVAVPFLWWFRMIEPWHALAVALSILCSENNEEVVKEAWPVMCQAYEKCATRYSGAGHNDVWSPLQSLMIKARSRHAQHIRQVLAVPIEQSDQGAPQTSPVMSKRSTWELGEGFSNMSFVSNNPAWTTDWPTDNSANDDHTWENWNKFIDDLGYSEQTGNVSMTDAWLMPEGW